MVTGGRGSLKSTHVQDFIIRLTYERGHGILFTRYTMASAELSIIPEFKTILQRLGVEHHFTVTRGKAINKKTGSFIYFSGIKTQQGNQTGRLKSMSGITTWVIEEGEDFNDEKTFETIDDSIRTPIHQNRIIWIQNPTTREHFIYKKFIKPKNKQIDVHGYDVTVSDMDHVEHIHVTYHIALKYLHQSIQDKIKQEIRNEKKAIAAEPGNEYKIKHSSRHYYNWIGGWLERAEGAIYDNWKEGPFDDSLPFCYGLDFGFTHPTALIKTAIDDAAKRVFWQQEIHAPGLSTESLMARIKKSVTNKESLIVCDHNEERTRRMIKKEGYNIKKALKGPGSVVAGIRALQEYEIIVTPESHELKTDLSNYVWADKVGEIPMKEWDDGPDAGRYAFSYLKKGPRKGARRVQPPTVSRIYRNY